jgi:3-methyladenine DNA glycosylase AlkD
MSKKALLEVESRFRKIPVKKYPFKPESYIGNNESTYQFLNLRVPQIRTELKKGFSFSNDKNNWLIWDYIYKKSQIYEVLSAAVTWASEQPTEEKVCNRELLIGWSDRADNWALADGLCSILAQFFEQDPQYMKIVFDRWSHSENPWQRRMSIVGIVYYYNFRKKHPPYSYFKKMLLRQFSHPHTYVQKGVGWTLRECYSIYPKKTYALLLHKVKQITPVAWQASTERLTKIEKAKLLKLRKR